MALRKGKWLMQQGAEEQGAEGKDEEDKAMECRGDRRNELLFFSSAPVSLCSSTTLMLYTIGLNKRAIPSSGY